MIFKRNRKKILILNLMFIGFFSVFTLTFADVGDIGHWRDSVGNQLPNTSYTPFDFSLELQNDGIYSKPSASIIELGEAGDYLLIASMRDNDNSNGRYNAQARLVQLTGSGELFSSHYSGYSRDSSEDQSWTRVVGVVLGATAGTQLQVQKRRDTDVPTGGSVINRSDVQIVKINPTNYGLYSISGAGNTYGGTNPTAVSFDSVIAESDSAVIEADLASDTLRLKGDNKAYLIAWSTSFVGNSGNVRTQRIGHLEYDGADELNTRAYCYRRNAANEYCGLGSMDILETSDLDRDVRVEIFRGPGVAADQGGAGSDSNIQTDGLGRFVVLELPDSLEILKSRDLVGLQDLSSVQNLNIARDLDFNYSYSFSKETNTDVDIFHPTDVFAWANVWTARNNVSSAARQTSYGSIVIDGVDQSTGEHGSYSRGNQGPNDTFAMSFHPAGIFTTSTSGQNIAVNSYPLAGGEAGGVDRTQPDTLGFFLLDLDTLIPPSLNQNSYRFFGNTDSADVSGPLSVQNTAANLTTSGQEFRLRSLIGVEDNKLRYQAEDFKLQFAEKVGSCDAAFSGEVYADVTNSTAISFHDNVSVSDGVALIANPNDPNDGLNIVVSQSYEEGNPFFGFNTNVNPGQNGKWDFSLRDNGALPETSYCFRFVHSDDSLLDTYSFIPELTTAPPPLDFCPSPVSSFPYSEGFESGAFGLWEQSTLDDNDWLNHTLDTPSNNTGPDSASEGSRYIYVEASTNVNGSPDKRSILTSPCFELSSLNPMRFDFDYHMFGGATMGDFDVEISTNGLSWQSLFSQNTNQGNQWNSESLDLSLYQGQQVKLRLNRFVSTSWQADVAVDNISLEEIPLGGSPANPFTSLSQAYLNVNVDGDYYFNLNGEAFRTFVNSDAWVLVASGEGDTTESAYTQVDSLDLQSDNILNSSIVAEMTELTELRMNATSGPSLPFDVTSSHPTAISRFLAYTSIGYDPNNLPLDDMFSGIDTDNVLAPVSACNGGSTSLDLKIIHNCGNAAGMHWIPNEQLDFANGANDLNLWVRAAVLPQEISFSITNNDVGFGQADFLASRYASFNGLGSATPEVASIIDVSTNASSGYVLEMESTGLSCLSCDTSYDISPIGGLATNSNPGVEQFGLRIAGVGGTGQVQIPYDTAAYAYDTSAFPASIATGTDDNVNTEYQLEYLLDIDPLTPAGEYELVATFTAHGIF